VKAKILSIIKYVLILSIGVGMLWLAFSGVSLKDTIKHIMNAKMLWLFLSVAASLIAFYSRALRWNLLIEPLGYKPSDSNTFAALMVGYLANLAVPRLGEVSRCGAISKVESVPFNSVLGTVIIERIIDVLCLLICIMLVAFNEYERLGNFLYENIYIPVTSKFSIIANNPLVVLAVAIVLIGVIYLLFRRHKKGGQKVAKFSALIKGVVNGIDSVRRMKRPVAFIAHTVLIWFMYFLMSYVCFRALEPTSLLNWHAGLFVLVVGGMGMSAPVQGGIGAYHLLVSQGLILYGISKENGLAFATLMHGSQTLVVIIIGGLSYLYLFLKKKNASTNTNTTDFRQNTQ
jgi:uncharacterized protein (TIRG00374 family)